MEPSLSSDGNQARVHANMPERLAQIAQAKSLAQNHEGAKVVRAAADGSGVRSVLFGSFLLVATFFIAPASAAIASHPLGVSVEAGAPDLVSVRLTLRPRPWLRLGVGPVSDLFSAGVGGGITVVPLRSLVSPSLTVEGGYLFDGATRGIPQSLGIPIGAGRAAYGYVDGHVGLEIGANRRVCFFLHAGVSYVDVTAHGDGFAAAHLTLFGPSAKLGLSVFF